MPTPADDSREPELGELIVAARDLPPIERERFLALLAQQDPALRARVESGLEREGGSAAPDATRVDVPHRLARLPSAGGEGEPRSGDGDGAARSGGGEAAGARQALGRRIGHYRLLEVLGEGGMGTVYLAEQEHPIRRRVALKVVQARLHGDRARQRFELERQSLARMSHPNVAQVYEAGETDDGQPFVVMEHVAGEPITTWCDARTLPLAARVELFEAVCRGVHHAHQKGILHRDIKPSNVLVTEVEGRPLPKLIDFGIAKPIGDGAEHTPQLTGFGLIGTPAYLSPESVLAPGDADADVRSDVYGLGVLLYELLAGELPFVRHSGDLARLVDEVRSQEAEPPSRRVARLPPEKLARRAARRAEAPAHLVRRLRGELDWITVKALAREREDRYGSAAELAADLARHRRHEPVVAGPPSRWYAARKFARRHTGAVVAAGLVALALVGGITARTVEARRASREAERANLEARRANHEAETARQVSDFLVEMFAVADPGESRGATITARELLDRGAERIRTELPDQPLTRARLMLTMAHAYRQLGLYGSAGELVAEAVALRERELGRDDPEVASALIEAGRLAYEEARYGNAEAAYRRALAIRTRSFGEADPRTAEPIAALGDLYEVQARFAEAEPLMRRALAVRLAALGEEHLDVAESLDRLGVLLANSGRAAEGLPLFERAVAIRERVLGPDHPQLAYAYNGLAIAYARTDDLARSRDTFAKSAAIRERVLGPRHADFAQSLNNLAIVHLELGETDQGIALLRRAVEVYTAALGERHPRVAAAWHNLGTAYGDLGRWAEAERHVRHGLALREAIAGPDSPALAAHLHHLGRALLRQGRHAEAEAPLRRALALREAGAPGPLDQTVEDLVEVLRATGREPEAAALLRRHPPEDPAAQR